MGFSAVYLQNRTRLMSSCADTSPFRTLRVTSVAPELLLQSEWRKLTGSGTDCPEVTGVMLGHPFYISLQTATGAPLQLQNFSALQRAACSGSSSMTARGRALPAEAHLVVSSALLVLSASGSEKGSVYG